MKFDFTPYLDSYASSFLKDGVIGDGNTPSLPSWKEMKEMMDELLSLLFPSGEEISSPGLLKSVLSRHMERVSDLFFRAAVLSYRTGCSEAEADRKAWELTALLLGEIPSIREKLKKDAEAGFNGDPAAKSTTEIILSYPGFKAIAMHRIGHFLYTKGVPYIPRMLNELVHSETGIDIHPGAEIGEYFFIDHGTGVVIGETTVIGNHVKIYQGVTLGALSFPKDGCGALLRDIKRHPTLSDGVTVYSNASILGPVTIGEGSTIGSSTWVKENIPPFSLVLPGKSESVIRTRKQ